MADSFNNKIRKITSAGVVTTFAGTGSSGSTNGTSATFVNPLGVAVGLAGTIYVADTANHIIRKISSSGTTSLFAGRPNGPGHSDGTGTEASFYLPYGITADSSGNIYVADTGNHSIRKITVGGDVTTIAGSTTSGSSDGSGLAASFYQPKGIYAASGGVLYVADTGNNKIRKIVQ